MNAWTHPRGVDENSAKKLVWHIKGINLSGQPRVAIMLQYGYC
ncbi:hypothetical protein [Streptomyces sp. E1N211]|nr:hypothetical protein [Streptomyces sp. E1N211]